MGRGPAARQGFKPETIKRALVHSKTRDGRDNGYAFGWIVDVDDGKLRELSHVGAWGGFHTSVDRDLAGNRTVVVLSNWDALDIGAITWPIEHLFWAMPRNEK